MSSAATIERLFGRQNDSLIVGRPTADNASLDIRQRTLECGPLRHHLNVSYSATNGHVPPVAPSGGKPVAPSGRVAHIWVAHLRDGFIVGGWPQSPNVHHRSGCPRSLALGDRGCSHRSRRDAKTVTT